VLTVQNGLGNAETIAEYVPRERVIDGTTAQGATVEGPGHVRHAGGGETTIGRRFAPNDDTVLAVGELLTDAGVDTTLQRTRETAVWTKLLVNAGVNAATALARVPNGALVEDAPGERLLRRAVEEGFPSRGQRAWTSRRTPLSAPGRSRSGRRRTARRCARTSRAGRTPKSKR